MNRILIPMLVFMAWATSISAQITRQQADKIVWEHVQNVVSPPYLLYVNTNMPKEEGITINTFNEETVKLKYNCWAYYLNENPSLNEPSQHRYLFVKEDDGNLLEIITTNDLGPKELTEWMMVEQVNIVELSGESIRVYPNPTNGKLTMDNGQLTIKSVEVFDVYGRNVSCLMSLVSNHHINISHLASGIYFVKIETEKETVTKKVIKN